MVEYKKQIPRLRRLPVQVPITQANVDLFLGSEIMNLSKGGVFIRSDISAPLGSEVEFQFTLPESNRVIRALGTVVWTRSAGNFTKPMYPEHPPGMGVQFKQIDVDDLDSILEEIERFIQNP